MTDVTVLGMGAMGRALAQARVRSGRSVTVWNRTPGRSVEGADTAPTAADAVAAARSSCAWSTAPPRTRSWTRPT